jgi:hypothetical protein
MPDNLFPLINIIRENDVDFIVYFSITSML